MTVGVSHLRPAAKAVFHASSDLPSGQDLSLYEVLTEDLGGDAWVRFRFLAPGIGAGQGLLAFADVEADFEYLCRLVALPYLLEFALSADVVTITMLDREVAFGDTDPEATQYVEVYRVTGGACVWEGL